MSDIKVLDRSTINKIAAGEVVERPSSVVKELVENSIDAGATFITIEIKDGGLAFIKILDNGKGIPRNQVRTAFLPHATSKISDIGDLYNVMSLGFRGEALASIAAVSQVEMLTKTMDEDIGTKIEIYGGNVLGITEESATIGTCFYIRNIFYNVPARKKFLKKPSTESSYITDIVNKLALGHPEISFKYINNGSVILHSSGNSDLKTTIYHVYGKEISEKMIEVNYSVDDFKIYGLLGKPELCRSNRTYENLFINGRFIKSEIVQRAVEDSYKTRLIISKFPVYLLNIEIPPSTVDVNVHPTKIEVRFQNEELIYNAVLEAVNNVLKNENLIPEFKLDESPKEKHQESGEQLLTESTNDLQILEATTVNNIDDLKINDTNGTDEYMKSNNNNNIDDEIKNINELSDEINMFSGIAMADGADVAGFGKFIVEERANFEYCHDIDDKSLITESDKNVVAGESVTLSGKSAVQTKIKQESDTDKPPFCNARIIGLLFNTYWIASFEDKMYIIDQHAAHERILYEQLLNEYKKGHSLSQRLLEPQLFKLTHREQEILAENQYLIESFGFEFEIFGDSSYSVNTVPVIFKNPVKPNFFLDIIDALSNTKLSDLYDTKTEAIATIACRAAVKANDKLSIIEARELIEKLLMLENPFTCPHGRPTIIELSKYELEKKFKRVQ